MAAETHTLKIRIRRIVRLKNDVIDFSGERIRLKNGRSLCKSKTSGHRRIEVIGKPTAVYFCFLDRFSGSGCAPVTLASTLSKASLAVISLPRLLLCRYLCSLSQVRQRVLRTSSPAMATTEWSVVRLHREQWSSM